MLQRKRSIIKEFSLNTSTHGIPGIARSQSTCNRLFWVISLLLFTGTMSFFIVQGIQIYFTYPTQTSVDVIIEWPQAFPAVTICNYSPLRYDRFNSPFQRYLKLLNIINSTESTEMKIDHVGYIRSFLLYKLNRDESLDEYFYPLNSMLMSCNYNGLSCSTKNFTSFVSPSYGFCYTFNAKLKNTSRNGIRYNTDNGRIGLLELRLYVHHQQYIPYMSNG